jgi:peroxiredoxin (alkyl hydroperoxide reductase subunit C)
VVTLAPPPPAWGIRAHGLPAGAPAPELGLPATPGWSLVRLADYRGSPIVLIFYPGDFTPVCTSELGLFNELLPEFGCFGAKLLAVSCDSLWSHVAYAQELNIQVPLLSDYHPKGVGSRRYDVYREEDGISERALFVIDGDGVISWAYVSPIEQNPGADGVLQALERLTGRHLDLPPAPEATP